VRVLVAEDHQNLARSIVDGLRDEGYAVDLTADGSEAEYLIGAHQYDCIVLDIMLPNKEGWEILQAMRQKGNKTPVLCLTARDTIEDRVKGLNLGADDYLIKPFAWEELLARVRALMRRGSSGGSAQITVGDLVIDTAAKTAIRGGKTITLTAREFALLEYLVSRQGQVVSRTDIWEHLYDHNDESTSNVVDVYIGYLRSKIDQGFEQKLIHTRRGHGYMVAALTPEEQAT
jgi:DNA-binding response OmpR family regulator